MTAISLPEVSVHEFLRQESEKDLLRFSTAGSVDDGKSTLIGRLLYDTQSVYDDQVRSIQGKGTTAPGQLDFALLTDGLRAEREQGITIDVAYRYFSTARRKFIIADTPGHEQYTRNMATGASTADAAIVLVDARKGVLVQSRRHAYIASLLRVRHVVVAINKMDLVGFDEGTFRAIEQDFRQVLDRIALDTGNPVEATFVPISALLGDNVVHRSSTMTWYHGPSILELLESLPPAAHGQQSAFRFPVQRVVRPDHTFRGFAGQIASGTVREGDVITVLPSGTSAQVERIVTWDGDLREASAPLSVTLVLDREIDVSRGDVIVPIESQAQLANRITASLVWMDQRPLELDRRYLIKHASRTSPAFVASIDHRTNVATLEREETSTLEMNSIGVVHLTLTSAIAFDPYAENRSTGAFILIDPATNATVAAGMISQGTLLSAVVSDRTDAGPVQPQEREARWGHRGAVVELSAPNSIVDAIERKLFASGAAVTRVDAASEEFLMHPQLIDIVLGLQIRAGLLTLLVREPENAAYSAQAEGNQIALDGDSPEQAAAFVLQLLQSAGILRANGKANLI